MHSPITIRASCAVCGLVTFRHKGWFLVVENRWLDRIKIFSWHSTLATQADMKSVCCREHLKALIAHWLTQASLRLPPTPRPRFSIGSDADLTDVDLSPTYMGRLVGELAVHRESFSRVWSGSPAALECILDALIAGGTEGKPHPVECQLFTLPPKSTHGMSLQ